MRLSYLINNHCYKKLYGKHRPAEQKWTFQFHTKTEIIYMYFKMYQLMYPSSFGILTRKQFIAAELQLQWEFEVTGHGPSTIIFHEATVLQLIVLSCALILNYIHIQDTVDGFSSLFLPPVVKRHFSNKYEIYDFLIHLFDLGFFFQRFDPSLLLRPFLIPKDESLFRKNIETFSSLVFCLVFSNKSYLSRTF